MMAVALPKQMNACAAPHIPEGVIAQPSEPHGNPISCALRPSRDNPPASAPPFCGQAALTVSEAIPSSTAADIACLILTEALV